MVRASSSVATRRKETASRPSASATATAAATTTSWVSRGRRCETSTALQRSGRRVAYHEFWFEGDLAVAVGRGAGGLFEEEFHGGAAQLGAGLADRGEGDGGGAGELDVVVPDYGQVVGDGQAAADGVLEEAEGQEVV